MRVNRYDCHLNDYGKKMLMQISNLVIQDMWDILSMLQF